MSNEIDIRETRGVPQSIRFAGNGGGNARLVKLSQCVPCQIKLYTSRDKEYSVVSSVDIPALIEALLLAEQLWGLETNRGK